MKTHRLKTLHEYFLAVQSGSKTFEIRLNDRDFKAGDTVILEEYDPSTFCYTGDLMTFEIGYVCDYEQRENHVVFSLLEP